MTSMLDGTKVVSLTHYLQGPACVQFLGDLGADVVKVERLEGAYERHWSGAQSFVDGESTFYLLSGRNQRSIQVNFRTDEGQQILHRLIAEADVLVENFRPGVLKKYGFGHEDVKQFNPAIVYCSLSGYGSDGPRASEPGQDLLVQSLSGMMWLSGNAEEAPVPIGSAVVDQHSAALGALGIVAALYRRAQTGQGAKVDANLLSSALDLQIEPFNYFLNGTSLYPRSRSGISSRFHQAPYGAFKTADGWLTVSLSDMARLADVLEDSTLAKWSSEDQFVRREEVNESIARALTLKTNAEWIAEFTERGLWCAPVQSYDDIVDDPQLAANESIIEMDGREGARVRVLGHPVKYDGVAPTMRKRPPECGQDTADVLSGLGYSAEDIAELAERGVVGGDLT